VRTRRSIDELHEEIEELFSDLWHVPRFSGLRGGFRPQVDCFRTDEPPEFTIVVELAGVDLADVELVALDRELVIAGERRRPPARSRLSYYLMEIEYGQFRRRIALPEDVDTSAAQATYRDGILTIVLPIRAKPARLARIAIPLQENA
jgi:HSP20 family protein